MSNPTRSRTLAHPLSRRALLKTAAAGGAAGLVLPKAVAAAAAPATPKRGGTLAVGLGAGPGGLLTAQETGGTLVGSFYRTSPNPWYGGGAGTWASLVFEPLVAWDEHYANIVPALAERWEASDDGTVYTFHLRQGVTWHDGTPFTSADVVWSYTMLASPGLAASWQPPYVDLITGAVAFRNGEATEIPGLKAPDDYTVEITVEQPSPLFLQQMAMLWILPKHLLEGKPAETLHEDPFFVDSVVGLGPFKFQQWEQDQFLTIVRNDAYYRGAPLLDTIVARKVDQTSVAILSQESGEMDIVHVTVPADIEAVQQNPDLDVFPGPGMILSSLGTGFQPPLLKDKRVRQALLYAIDRETMISSFFKGTAQIMNAPFSASWVPMDDVNPYPYDPERAKALLDEAGWDPNATLEVYSSNTEQFTGQLLAAFQQYFGDVGIKTTVLQTEFANKEADFNAGNYGLIYWGSSLGPDPDAVYIYFHSQSEYNPFYADPEIDRLLDQGRTTLDQAARAEIYSQLAVALADRCFWLPLWVPLRYWAVSKTVSGIHDRLGTPGLHIPFYSQAEKWSKAS